MIEHTHRSWEDVLINDTPGEEFSLNNLLIFQGDNSSQVVESENQTIVPPNDAQNELITQHEPPDQGKDLSNFRYPSVVHFLSFLFPLGKTMEESNDTSHIPTI